MPKHRLVFFLLTDHFPIFNFSSTQKNDHIISNSDSKFRLFTSKNKECFERLMEVTWDDVLKSSDTEAANQLFMSTLSSVFQTSFPLVKPRNKSASIDNQPWFTKGLYKSSISKIKLYKKFLTNPTPLNSAKYKKYRNKYNHLIRISKKKWQIQRILKQY